MSMIISPRRPSRVERCFTLTIFLFMFISVALHSIVVLEHFDSVRSFVVSLPFWCLVAHLIWILVPSVLLPAPRSSSLGRISLKLFVCTLPMLFCGEISLLLLSQLTCSSTECFLLAIKWSIFVSGLLISFWTGTFNHPSMLRREIFPEVQSIYCLSQ